MGGDQNGQANQGSALQSRYAPNLTGSSHVGLGDWSADDIMLYLKTGRNRFVMASGPMADAVTHSTSHLTDVDLQAIATYLKSLPPGGGTLPQPIPAEEPKMQRGGVVVSWRRDPSPDARPSRSAFPNWRNDLPRSDVARQGAVTSGPRWLSASREFPGREKPGAGGFEGRA